MRSTIRTSGRSGRAVTGRSGTRVAAAGAAAALGLAVLAGCGYGTYSEDHLVTSAGDSREGTTVERVLEDTESLEGRTLTVQGRVTGTIAGSALLLVGAQAGAGPLLVVHDPQVEVAEGDAVTVTGVVRQAFDQQATEAELGVDLDDAVVDRFAADPYLIAVTIDDQVP